MPDGSAQSFHRPPVLPMNRPMFQQLNCATRRDMLAVGVEAGIECCRTVTSALAHLHDETAPMLGKPLAPPRPVRHGAFHGAPEFWRVVRLAQVDEFVHHYVVDDARR